MERERKSERIPFLLSPSQRRKLEALSAGADSISAYLRALIDREAEREGITGEEGGS